MHDDISIIRYSCDNACRLRTLRSIVARVTLLTYPRLRPPQQVNNTNRIQHQPPSMERLFRELECPVCMSVRQGRIYECPNAHIICQKCHDKGPYINDVG